MNCIMGGEGGEGRGEGADRLRNTRVTMHASERGEGSGERADRLGTDEQLRN